MSAPDSCEMELLVQADFDGELDAAQAAALEAHRRDCAICQRSSDMLRETRQALRAEPSYHRAPPHLRQAVAARLAQAVPPVVPAPAPLRPRRWWPAGAGFGLGAAVAAGLMLLVAMPGQQGAVDQVVAGHIRALQPGHLTDVVSTDRHTVKPWFDGKLDFAPPVKDLAEKGFRLEGGRLDYLAGRPVAALAYAHGKHPLDLFVWPEAGADRTPEATERNGYTVIHWIENGMSLWAVSDMERGELSAFVREWRAAS